MHTSFGAAEVDQSTTQLIIDQIEELVVTLIEEIRERPAVAVAILAAVVGAIIGGILASGMRRPKPVTRRVARRMGSVSDMADLAGLVFKLLENPLVRSYILAAVAGQMKKRFTTT
jgi:hypothetical protein